ncbi:MAG TPA: hypothetical protein VF816_10100 [Rhodocyclaceae bacterium]
MFRIHLEIMTGKFVVQVLFMDFIWLSVRESDHQRGRPSSSRIRRFDTYSQARAWVNSVGLYISLAEQQSKRVLYEGRRAAPAPALPQDSRARNSALV